MDQSGKILALTQLPDILKPLRNAGKTIVHCHGVFDLLHVGHIRYLEQARTMGDVLVVTITADPFVGKGPHRPAFTQQLRAEALAALSAVDYVAINNAESAEPAINAIRPAFYVKGKDYVGRVPKKGSKLELEEAAVKSHGGKLAFIDDILFSSSSLINAHLSPFPEHVTDYLRRMREKKAAEQLTNALDRIRGLKVLVVGETIIDEYHYCDVIGKAGKEPVLVGKFKSSEKFIGGVLAIANHVAGFCDQVGVLTTLGADDTQEDFIRGKLRDNVHPTFITQMARPTIVKRRYVEEYLLQKIFEVYVINDNPQTTEEERAICEALEAELPHYDVVIVADYGHAMLTPRSREVLCTKSKFLAVNTQANAGNAGLHTISLYPRCDYLSISASELRLDLRAQGGDPEELLPKLRNKVHCPRITISLGKNGMLCFDEKFGCVKAPALTQHAVDRVGSGDAVLSVTSPLASIGVDLDVMAFMGNVAGAEAVRIVGHRSFLEASTLQKHALSLLK